MNIKTFLQNLFVQKQNLIKKNPELKHAFVDIYSSRLKTHIPFLPIRCFRDFDIYHPSVGDKEIAPLVKFLSSGSTNDTRAEHCFSEYGLNLYEKKSSEGFRKFLNDHSIKNPIIISLVPSTSEWPNSSLAAMIQMFHTYGFDVKWCDANDPEYFLNLFLNLAKDKNPIVFGTTFHHLQLINHFRHKKEFDKKNNIFKHFNLSIIDTGGTKGKTQAFTLSETKEIFEDFYGSHVNLFSEYGMCELASQAWSLNAKHDGTFRTNDTLIPLAIDLQKNTILPKSKTGFLSFIDTVNVDSYGAIITEDLGQIISQPQGIFKLIGRAPDASIKGCSLNIKNFQFMDPAVKPRDDTQLDLAVKPLLSSRGLTAGSIVKKLNKKYWNFSSKNDFLKSFHSLKELFLNKKFILNHEILSTVKNDDFKHKNILLIAASNTPIAFVYPLILCGMNQAHSFTLKIPSLRAGDPLSETIRCQMIDLFQNLSTFFPKTKFFLHSSKSLKNDFQKYDTICVFGTDTTLQIVKEQSLPSTKFFGFGDIKNAFCVDLKLHTAEFLAKICSIWNGRGCLTPVCLFVDSKRSDKFISDFFNYLTRMMNRRIKSFKNTLIDHKVAYKNITFHDHNYLYVKRILKKTIRADEINILRSRFVTVVDLSKISPKKIKKISIDFTFGGSGFIYILPAKMKNEFSELSFYPIFPTIFDFQKNL